MHSANTDSTGYGIGSRALEASADGRWFVQADGSHLVVLNAATGRTATVTPVDFRAYLLATTAFSADGAFLWRVSTYSGISAHPFSVSPDGQSVDIGPAESIDPSRGFTIAAVSADRRWLALTNSDDGTVKVLRVSAIGAVVEKKLEWPVPGAYSAAFSPDGERLLVNCSGTGEDLAAQHLRLYRTADGTVERELPAQARGEVVWSADGTTAMTSNGSDSSTIWNTADWTPRCRLTGELGGDATTFTLAADGRTALVFRDNWINVISTAAGQVITRLELRDANGFCLALRQIAPGRFAALQLDGRIDLLDVDAWNAELTKLGLGW
jgi:WD40 repeat protein